MASRLRSLLRVGRRDPELVWLAARVFVLLMVTRAMVLLVPMRRITKYLGTPNAETSHDDTTVDDGRYARRVGWAIAKLAPHTPTNSNCYPQALTAWWLLHRRRVPTTLYYGAAFADGGELEAHVWIRCGSIDVAGGAASHRFAQLSSFADECPSRAPRLRR